MTENSNQANPNQLFNIQKIYTRDISFESPNAPNVFKGADWKPSIDINIQSLSNKLADKVYEIVLTITATAKLEDGHTAYLAEVHQAGIFTIDGFAKEDLTYMLGSYCPNILFPYARECLSNLVARGGFPQMIMQPVNFDALLAEKIESTKQQETSTTAQ